MKKLLSLFFAFAMILSVAFVADSFSANAQNNGVATKTTQGGKYVYRKGENGTRYVYRKTSKGTVYVGKQTYKGGKWTYGKVKRNTKAVVSRTKKIFK